MGTPCRERLRRGAAALSWQPIRVHDEDTVRAARTSSAEERHAGRNQAASDGAASRARS